MAAALNAKLENMNIAFEIVVIVVLVLLNGLLAMAEFAVVSAQQVRLQERANNGSAGARAALALADAPDRFLATVQFGITLIGILAGAVGGATLAGRASGALDDVAVVGQYSDAVAFTLVVGATTYLSLVFGELVPKRLALQQPESIAAILARPLTTLARIGRPIVALLSYSTRGVLRLLGVPETVENQVSEEEIRILIEQGARSGAIEETEEAMALGIFDLADLTASDIMTPRRQIVWVDVEASEPENRARMAESGHSYYPAYDGSPDHALGFVAIKDLWRERDFDLRGVVTPPLYVPESAPAFGVMELFQQTGIRRALVVDEYGAIQGLVTLHDLLEAIVGELDAAIDADQPIIEREDGSWLVDGMTPLHELRDILQVDLAPVDDPGRYQTLGGLVMAELGKVPIPSEHFERAGLRFEVVDMDQARVDKVLVTRTAPADLAGLE